MTAPVNRNGPGACAAGSPIPKFRYAQRICAECDRMFDLLDDVDAQEWFYGHDCEVE
jgi:hypothetical protein